MLKRKNKGIKQRKSVKSVGVVTIQLSEEEIKEFDIMYSLFDVNSDI
ncbi:hypothetical protein [Clostridium sp.]